MSKLRVSGFSISVDGFGAGPQQSRNTPLGIGGESLHEWLTATRTFKKMIGQTGGSTGIDDELAAASMENVGAWIMGRNMFSPSRGPWPDDGWKGWWGKNPPYHSDVFVLTHHEREPIALEGNTTFHFVNGGIHEALERARDAAGERSIRLLGGASTIRQYLSERLVDEMHLAISPIVLGSGERLIVGIDLCALGYDVASSVTSPHALHVVLKRH